MNPDKGALARVIIKDFICKDGVSSLYPNNILKSLGQKAKQYGVSKNEYKEFLTPIIKEIFDDILDALENTDWTEEN